ncbi:MAG: ISNCY family transposase, partial [bacterium]
MSTKETITMTKREAERFLIISNLIDKKINGTEAGKQIGLSVRQARRLKRSVITLGPKGIIHGNRGKTGNRKLADKIRDKIVSLLHKKYPYFNPLLAKEHLEDDDNIKTNKETIRQLMIKEGLWKRKARKKPQYFSQRERKDSYGEMEQFDGSYHHWFSTKEEQCLLLAVDDATGKITGAMFKDNESVLAVFRFWKEYIERRGRPLTIYLDKFSTYKINHKNAVDNKDLLTQFQRATKEIGIKLITANSPEAKGRVEKMNGTLQGRLVRELRFRNIRNAEEANRFLNEEFIPKFNAKFSVVAKNKTDLHRQIGERIDLDQVFSLQEERTVGNDYVVRYKNKYYQLNETQPTTVYKGSKVTIETRLTGE